MKLQLNRIHTVDLAIITAADSRFFEFLCGLIRSLQDKSAGRSYKLYVFDLGLTDTQRIWLKTQGASVVTELDPLWHHEWPRHYSVFLSRSRLPSILPGHEVYLWIDSDAWIQSWEGIDLFITGALEDGFAVAPDIDAAYNRDIIFSLHHDSYAIFGENYVIALKNGGGVNAGVFAGRHDAKHWSVWRELIETNIKSIPSQNAIFLFDQTALGITTQYCGLKTTLLPAKCNWMCHIALPKVSENGAILLNPIYPYDPLLIVHMTAQTKWILFSLSCPDGTELSRKLDYPTPLVFPANDYIAPGLQTIFLDLGFPNMVAGDQSTNTWPHLRKNLPHTWLVDSRLPYMGFVNRDESHILYNLALRFRGKKGLEIGCLLGWSAAHIGAAGVILDVVDPLLARDDVKSIVKQSLEITAVVQRVRLWPGSSPASIHELANQQGPWSFFFIDGDHDGEAPTEDVKACLPYAAEDAAMVFHDLMSPDVTSAVMYLKSLGWKIRVYHTAQIMAVAWRGNLDPVAHRPDPRITWSIPNHVISLID